MADKYLTRIAAAKAELEAAETAHRDAFKRALADLFEEYGLCLQARFEGGMEIVDCQGYSEKDLPE
jgi:hypothetical protein